MWGIATLTIDVSISSRTAASVTAIAIRYLYLYLSSTGATSGARRTMICAVPRGPAVAMRVGSVTAGCWLLAPGGWLLVAGCWLLVANVALAGRITGRCQQPATAVLAH